MKNLNKLVLLGFLLITSSSALIEPNNEISTRQIKKAPTIKYALNFDGTYEVPLKLDLKMGQDAFSKVGKIEKISDNFYFTFTQVDNSNLADMKLLKDGKVGEMVEINGKETRYTYSVSEEDLSKPFDFSVIVTVMNKLVNFSVELDLNNINYVSDTVEDRGERPAQYIPIINTDAKDVEVEKGSLYVFPEAKATIKTEELEVKKEVYYINGDNKETIENDGTSFKADKIGKYKVIYKASSSDYKTSLGNDSETIYEYFVTSKIGAETLAKFESKNVDLVSKLQLQANIITTGEIYDKIKKCMSKIADNFEVFDLKFYEKTGAAYKLNEEVSFYLKADQYFDRTKIKVAFFNEDTLENYEVSNFGQYVKFNSNKDGIYIAYVEGVEFHMPIWEIALIVSSCVLVVILAIVTLIIIMKKRNKKEVLKTSKNDTLIDENEDKKVE